MLVENWDYLLIRLIEAIDGRNSSGVGDQNCIRTDAYNLAVFAVKVGMNQMSSSSDDPVPAHDVGERREEWAGDVLESLPGAYKDPDHNGEDKRDKL